MKSVTATALRRPVTTLMIFVCFALIGAISARLLPLEFLPDVEFPGVLVEVPYPGSSPEEVERLIVRPIEEVLATMGGIRTMRSSSTPEGGFVFVFFGWDADTTAKGVEARDKIDGIRQTLPEDVRRVHVRKFATTDDPMLSLTISSERDLSGSYELLERSVKRPIERLEGVASVTLEGVDARQVRILLIADRVAAHGIDLNELRDRLMGANFSMSGGVVSDEGSGRRIRVHPLGELRSLDEIARVPVDDRGLRLGDIAEIAYEPPPRRYGRRLDGQPAIGLDIHRETGANLVDVHRRVVAEVERIAQQPEMQGIQLNVLFSQADGVVTSLTDLAFSGLVGALLSLLVLYFFLRQITTTLIVMLAIPSALLVTLGFMYFLGLTLNILSMMGLMLAVGMLVDNAVVVTESIYRSKQRHPGHPGKATLLGVREVALAVTAGTLTTVIVFLPNIFGAQNEVTVFLAHVAYAITISLIASLIIARTLIPLLTLRVEPPPPASPGDWLPRLIDRYARVLAWTLRHRWLTCFCVLALAASVAVPIRLVDVNMNDESESDRIFLRYQVNAEYSLDKVREAVDSVEAYLNADRDGFELESVYSWYNNSNATTSLVLREDRSRSSREIREAVRAGLPPIAIGAPTFDVSRDGSDENVRLRLLGESSERLFALSREVARALAAVDGLADVRTDAAAGTPEVRVTVNRDRALQYGFTAEEVAQAISVAMRGENLRELRGAEGEIPMRLEFQDADRQSAAQLANLPLRNSRGERVTLATVADFETAPGPRNIEREERLTGVAIEANLVGLTLNDARQRITDVMNQIELPAGYIWTFGEAFENEDETMQTMALNMLLALALIVIVMAALFESVLYPLSIITSILFSFIGVFWFFLITGTTFSLMAMIGLLILMGIVVNNGIVLID
ncbi:MAG: efflux RND transporter permease subunit, partial [Gammaproteobacteria bacterium]|nr:efflux RND transporter permease subunit [Gammaproteobacteria bacterium]